MQINTRDEPAQRMTTLERSLAQLVHQGKVALHEAERAANRLPSFEDEMKRLA